MCTERGVLANEVAVCAGRTVLPCNDEFLALRMASGAIVVAPTTVWRRPHCILNLPLSA